MTTVEFLSHLRTQGVKLWADGERLRCNAPSAALTPELQTQLELRKSDILTFLKAEAVVDSSALALEAVARESHIPLSFSQQRLWFLDQLEPGSCVYNIPLALHLRGQLEHGALEDSLDQIVSRHEVLRTTYAAGDGVPVQVVSGIRHLELERTDLTHLSPSNQNEELRRRIKEEATRPFNLSFDLMLRASLLRLAPEEHILLLVMHHIAMDGWSVGVLFRELGALYEAFSCGQPSPLPDLSLQYADYAVWQREQFSGQNLAAERSYWRQQLAGVPMLDLPTDRPRPAIQTYSGAQQAIRLSSVLTNQLKRLSRGEGVTLFAVLLAAFKTLLYRYTRCDDIVVGSPISGRNRTEFEGIIGLFINNLVFRTDFSGEPGFRELLRRVWKVALEAYKHQNLPFEKLVEELQPDRSLSHSALFQVMFILEPRIGIELPGLTVTPVVVDDPTAKFDLTVSLTEASGALEGFFEYDTDLFDRVTVNKMIDHFQALLESIAADPEQRIADLSMLSEAERQQLLVDWNETEADFPQEKCTHELFEEQVERTPDAVAVIGEGGRLTYRELDDRAERLARQLRLMGVRPDALVGICLERSVDLVVGLLGILKAGGAYVPIDPAYPAGRIGFMIEDSAMSVLLTQERVRGNLPQSRCRVVSMERLGSGGELDVSEVTGERAGPEDLAYVLYTSGSTGKPKGVEISHRAVVNFLSSMREQPGMTEQDVLLAVTTISFDIAGLELFLPLIVGACVVIVDREAALDGRRLIEQLENNGATVMQATPATWRMLLEAGWQGSKQLKILCGGEALTGELASQLLERGSSLWNLYGPTESTIWSTLYRVESGDGAVPIGRPIANTEIYILDRYLKPVPIGVPGELYIGGAGLASGYLNRPELTAEKFIANPFSDDPNARLYKTGDLARYLSDGNIEFLGRIDHQVKLRGFRIELGEVESVLSQHPGVRESVVVVREDEPGDKRLVAYVVPDQDPIPAVSALRDFLKSKLPDYMAPSAFVELDALPLTPNGKLDRRALPAPERRSVEIEKTFVAPRTPVEQTLAQIWREILHVKRVGIYDNFFGMGGHSLLATQVMSRVRSFFGIEIPLRSLFESPSVAGLAERIETLFWAAEQFQAHPSIKTPEDQVELEL